jgi:uncharacterized protein (TIGR02996 family)
MTPADAFLRDILDRPDDDTSRLIYADWLEEQGNSTDAARAQLIRIQCRLATLPEGNEQRPALEAQQRQLLNRHGEEWAQPLAGLVTDYSFHRGFIDEVVVDVLTLLSDSEELFRLAPVQHLHLRWGVTMCGMNELMPLPAGAGFMPAFCECPNLDRLRSLDLAANALGNVAVQALSVCDRFTQLEALDLSSNSIGDAGVRALVRSALLTQLTHLDLSRNAIGPAGVRMLAAMLEDRAAAGAELPLRSLDLSENRLGTAGIRALASSERLQRVARF